MQFYNIYFIFFGLVFSTMSLMGQVNYPKYENPLNIDLIASGTFGELRSGHFHTGIDIKTQQKKGLKVRAISDGFISRIRISHWSYGKAIYIDHAEDYTSVYGHLKHFSKKIESYIKALQYKKESYEIDVKIPFGDLEIKKGEVIAFSGNTGNSAGPHLHFEIRETKTQAALNPFLFGIDIKDTRKPTITSLFAYALSDTSSVNGSTDKVQVNFNKQKNGMLLADKVKASGRIGIGIGGYDKLNKAANKNGFFKVSIFLNGKELLNYDFEKIYFEKMPYIYSFIDYTHYIQNKTYIQKCFVESKDELDIYNQNTNGIIDVKEGMDYTIEIQVFDYTGNKTVLIIPVQGVASKENIKKIPSGKKIIATRDNFFSLKTSKIYFPEDTFFKDFYFNVDERKNGIIVLDSTIPVKRSYSISIDVSNLSDFEKSKSFLAKINPNNTLDYQYSYLKDNLLIGKTKDLGAFKMVIDTIPPQILPKNVKNNTWISNKDVLEFIIKDDLSGIKSYRGEANGKWILMEYDAKKNHLSCNLNDIQFNTTKIKLSLVVKDYLENEENFEATLYKKIN